MRNLRIHIAATATIFAATAVACSDADTANLAPRDAAVVETQAQAPETADTGVLDIEVRGSGSSDVLLLPGLASPADVWDATAERLEGAHRLHLVGVRGFGGTPASSDTDSVADRIVDEVVAYLEANGLQDVTFVGHSLGGFTGLRVALASDRVGRVVVVDSLPFYPLVFAPDATPESVAPQAEMMLAQMGGMDAQAYARVARGNAAIMSKSPEAVTRIGDWAAASDPATVVDAMGTLMRTDLRPQLSDIDVPVHVLVAHDPAMGVDRDTYLGTWRTAYADVADLTFVPVDDSFHFIMFDQPEAFAAALDAALEETHQ